MPSIRQADYNELVRKATANETDEHYLIESLADKRRAIAALVECERVARTTPTLNDRSGMAYYPNAAIYDPGNSHVSTQPPPPPSLEDRLFQEVRELNGRVALLEARLAAVMAVAHYAIESFHA